MYMENIFNKLEVNDNELNNFRKLKTNYFISDILFIKNNKNYKIVIDYDKNYIGHLFGKEIEKDELIYTLKVGNKKLLKEVKKNQVVRYIKNILENKGV